MKVEKRNLLTIQDLFKFCQENKLYNFSSKEHGYKLKVQIPSSFEMDDNVDDNHRGMLKLKIRIFHTGLNRNGSFVSEEAAKEAMSTIKNRPVLAAIHQLDNGEWDFEGHNFEIITNEDGEEEINYIEKQVGSFDESEPFFEYDEELDKTYICSYAYISEGYTRAADIIRQKKGTKNSVELSIDEFSYNAKEHYLSLDKFYVSASTLLGSKDDGTEIGEGMLGSRADIADFSEQNNTSQFDVNKELLDEIKKLNEKLSHINIDNAEFSANKTLEEGGTRDVDNQKFLELLEKYNKTETDIEFEIEGLSDEELETKFAEVFGEEAEENPASEEGDESEESEEDENEESEDNSEENNEESDSEEGEGSEDAEDNEDSNNEGNDDAESDEDNYSSIVKYSVECKGEVKNYEVSLDEKIYAIQDLVNLTYGESDNTYYGVKVYDDYVIMLDYWSGRAYKQSYSEEDDAYILTGDRIEVYSVWVTKEEEEALKEMKANYSSISEQLSKYQNAEIKAQKEEILSDEAYAEFAETDEFKAIVNEMDSLTIEELRTKCELAFAKLVKAQGTFAFKEEKQETKKKNKIGINANFEQTNNEPYGDYFKSIEVQ